MAHCPKYKYNKRIHYNSNKATSTTDFEIGWLIIQNSTKMNATRTNWRNWDRAWSLQMAHDLKYKYKICNQYNLNKAGSTVDLQLDDLPSTFQKQHGTYNLNTARSTARLLYDDLQSIYNQDNKSNNVIFAADVVHLNQLHTANLWQITWNLSQILWYDGSPSDMQIKHTTNIAKLHRIYRGWLNTMAISCISKQLNATTIFQITRAPSGMS